MLPASQCPPVPLKEFFRAKPATLPRYTIHHRRTDTDTDTDIERLQRLRKAVLALFLLPFFLLLIFLLTSLRFIDWH